MTCATRNLGCHVIIANITINVTTDNSEACVGQYGACKAGAAWKGLNDYPCDGELKECGPRHQVMFILFRAKLYFYHSYQWA